MAATGVYIPQYEPASAGGAYFNAAPLTIVPGQPVKFSGSEDLLNVIWEPDGLTVTQPGLYFIQLSAEFNERENIVAITASGNEIPGTKQSASNYSVSAVKRLVPNTKLMIKNIGQTNATVLRANLTVVQVMEYFIHGFTYSGEVPNES
jgi:hypothetical protein